MDPDHFIFFDKAHKVTERPRAEFMEMPGLRLTSEQVQRLCGVERRVCQMVLDALVDAKFLCRKPDRAYARLTDGAVAHPRHRHIVTRLPSGAVAARDLPTPGHFLMRQDLPTG